MQEAAGAGEGGLGGEVRDRLSKRPVSHLIIEQTKELEVIRWRAHMAGSIGH